MSVAINGGFCGDYPPLNPFGCGSGDVLVPLTTDPFHSTDILSAGRGKSLRSFKAFSNEAGFYTTERIVNAYIGWVKESLYIVLKKQDVKIDLASGTERIVGNSYKFVLASKRGNWVYANKTLKRFGSVGDLLPDIDYFNANDCLNYQISRTTRAILFGGTYNPAALSLSEAWLRVGKDFNRFMSRIKARYGRVSHIRVWESQTNGYPHFHALIFFAEYVFENVRWIKSKHSNWRVVLKDKRFLQRCWSGGHSDIRAVSNPQRAFYYLGKYFSKYVESDSKKAVLTRAMTWVYGKRAFSLTTKFYPDLNTKGVTQSIDNLQYDLSGEIIGVVEDSHTFFVGCMAMRFSGGKEPPFYLEYSEKELPKPIKGVISELEDSLNDVSGFGKTIFPKMDTGSVMSISELRAFFNPNDVVPAHPIATYPSHLL